MNSQAESAAIIAALQERMVKKIIFRRWMVATNVHAFYKPRPPLLKPPSQRESVLLQEEQVKKLMSSDEMRQTTQEPKRVKPSRKTFNLKYGDIVYFKCYQLFESMGNYKGVISGDGIASNKLECLQNATFVSQLNLDQSNMKESRTIQSKFSQLLFQKCLFEVVNAKKYYFQDKIKEMGDDDEEMKKKAAEEIEENNDTYHRLYGQNVVFGEEIQLVHLYSQCILTLNIGVLAKQHCCRELSLEEQSNEYSNFRLFSLNSAKKQGEPILYSDQVILVNSLMSKWKLSVQDVNDLHANVGDGLEVNGSETGMSLKICNYLDNQTSKDIQQKGIKGKYLQSGDVITIKSRNSNGLIAIKKDKKFSEFLEQRRIYFTDPETNARKQMTQDYFVINELLRSDQLKSMYNFYVDTSEGMESNIDTLWEVQGKDSLTYSCPSYEKCFLIKHVLTGCFLMVFDGKIELTYNGLQNECLFYLKSKKPLDDPIPFSESAKIQSYTEPALILMCDSDIIRLTERSRKSDMASTVFVLGLANQELAKTAQRLQSLHLYLFQFYIFLQNWGVKYGIDDNEMLYDYNKAFNSQKSLSDEVRQLFQSLDNLKNYLTNNFLPTSNEEIRNRQNNARESGLINILISILMLIHFMIYGSSQNKQQYYEIPGQTKQKQKQTMQVPDKSAQKIAKQKLDPPPQTLQNNSSFQLTSNNCIEEIYAILQLCIRGNHDACNYLTRLNILSAKKRATQNDGKVINFLLNQLHYHRSAVQALLKESVRYTDVSGDNDHSALEDWVRQLDSIADDNIQDQCLYIEIISLIMTDPYENPINQSQNLCRRLIFKSKNGGQSIFDRSLVKFLINDQGGSSLIYQSKVSTDEFKQQNPDFTQVYQTFCFKNRESKVSKVLLSKKDFLCSQFLLDFVNLPTMRQQVRPEEKKLKIPILSHYETYTLNVLNLYAALCKGRNYKSIECIRSQCGIDQSFLLNILPQLKEHQLRYETALLNLYSIISIDCDPLVSIRKFTNNCYIQEDIMTFNLNGPTGVVFFDHSSSKSMKESESWKEFHNKNFEQDLMSQDEDPATQPLKAGDQEYKEHEEQKKFAEFIINKQARNGIIQRYINFLTYGDYQPSQIIQFQYPNHLRIKSEQKKNEKVNINYKLYAQFQLEFMLSIMKLINFSVDLGYNDLKTNIQILSILPNIFYSISLCVKMEKNFQQDVDFEQNLREIHIFVERDELIKNHRSKFERNWLIDFFLWTTSLIDDKLLVLKVYVEAISLLKTFYELKRNLQILKFIGFHKNNHKCKEGLQRKTLEQKNYLRKLKSFMSNGSSDEEIEDDPDKQSEITKINQLSDQSFMSFLDIFNEKNLVNFNSLLFYDLYCQQGRTRLNDDLLSLLISNFNYYSSLNDKMKSIEIIGNAKELELFSIINGNSKKFTTIIGPNELAEDARRLVKIIISKQQSESLEAYDIVNQYVQGVLELYQQRIKKNYLPSFQNILRNAGVHKILLGTIVDPKRVCFRVENMSPSIVIYYKNLVGFFEMFTQDNQLNSTELYPFIEKFLDIAMLSQKQAIDIEYVPLKITRLIIQILSWERLNEEFITDIVDLIVSKIDRARQNLLKHPSVLKQMGIFDKRDSNSDYLIQASGQQDAIFSSTKKGQEKEIILLKGIIQYLKILKSLTNTNEKPNTPIQHTKHLILQRIMKDVNLKFMILPQNFFPELRNQMLDQKSILKQAPVILQYNYIKLHSAAIILLTECCRNYRLGIQETQRTLLYDELKTIMLKPACYYIIKRAYLMLLFEVYINKVQEKDQSNEIIENDEVADILSRIIIPDIDQKQVFKFLEGLVRPNSVNHELKKQIAKKKIQYFEKKKDMRMQQEDTEEGAQIMRVQSILRDSYEFWKYIRDHGVIYFLVCVYDEMKDRVDLDRSDEQSLADEFSIIKNNIQKMKEIFKILEQDFRLKQDELNLEEYRDLILSIEEIIPQRKITKFGKNFLIGFGPNTKLQFEKFDTLNDDVGGEKKIQEQENVQVINNSFKRNVKIFLMRFMIQIDDLLLYCEKQNPDKDERKPLDIMPIVNYFKTYILTEELGTLEREDMLAIQQEKKLKEQQQTIQQNIVYDKWEIFKIAMRQMFQRKKIVKVVEDFSDKQDALKEEKDQQEQQNLIELFERYVCILAKLEHVQAQQKQKLFIQSQMDEEEEIDFEQEKQQQEEEIYNIRKEKFSDIEKNQLLGDTQIELLMWQLLEDQNHKDNRLTQFLSKSMDIFNSEEIYVIKLSRILLEGQMPTEDEMEQLGRSDAQESIKMQRKLATFKQYQIYIAQSNLDLAALQMMSSMNIDDQTKIEAIKFLIKLMKYGNETVQNRLYTHLTSNSALQSDFFNFLRNFLSTNVPERIAEVRQSYINEAKQRDQVEGDDDDTHQETGFECLSLGILEFLQVLCENVNEQFQKYLSKQNEDDTYASNINIIIEVSEFLSFFLEDNQLKLIQKNEILCKCIETLIEFCTGYENNRREICNNRRLFSLMNQKLLKELKLLFDREETQGLEFFAPCTTKEQVELTIFKERAETYSTFKSMVRLLLAMTAGNTDQESVQSLIEIVDLKQLLADCRQIFQQRIRPRISSVLWDKTCTQNNEHRNCKLDGICEVNPLYLTDEDNKLIETGFNIFIFFMYIRNLQIDTDMDVINLFSFDQEKQDSDYSREDDEKEIQQILLKKKAEEKLRKLKTKKQQVHVLTKKDVDEVSSAKYQQVEQSDQMKEAFDDFDIQADISDVKSVFRNISYDKAQYYFKKTEQFFQFYREFIGRVEIQKRDGKIEKVFFQKPFFTKYITDQIKTHLILESNRDSDQDRVLSLIENSNFYYVQMIHNQRMTRWKILDIGAKNWRYLKDISFILCLLLVILLIMYFDVVQDNSISEQKGLDLKVVFLVNSIVTIIQLVLNALIAIFSAIERYPISTTYKSTSGAKRLLILKKESGFHTNIFDRIYQYFVTLLESQLKQELVQNSYVRQGFLVLIDFHNIYNGVIFILTILAYDNSYIYAFLLLDIIYRSEDLQNIIKSITLNLKNLAKFTFLGLVGLLLYAIMGFTNFKDQYDVEQGAFSDTFILAVTSTIQKGLRSGGGIGDAMTVIEPSEQPDQYDQYWGLYFFEFTFFILFNILFIQIIFGIILDTFGELRDERQSLLKEVTDKCFVCSLSRNDIDSKGEFGWYYHIYLEHNVYHMLFYIIYVKQRNLNDCDALEKYVKQLIQEKGTDFFPLNKCLQLPETLEPEYNPEEQ